MVMVMTSEISSPWDCASVLALVGCLALVKGSLCDKTFLKGRIWCVKWCFFIVFAVHGTFFLGLFFRPPKSKRKYHI